jgi:hypothetical protein
MTEVPFRPDVRTDFDRRTPQSGPCDGDARQAVVAQAQTFPRRPCPSSGRPCPAPPLAALREIGMSVPDLSSADKARRDQSALRRAWSEPAGSQQDVRGRRCGRHGRSFNGPDDRSIHRADVTHPPRTTRSGPQWRAVSQLAPREAWQAGACAGLPRRSSRTTARYRAAIFPGHPRPPVARTGNPGPGRSR